MITSADEQMNFNEFNLITLQRQKYSISKYGMIGFSRRHDEEKYNTILINAERQEYKINNETSWRERT